MWRRLVVTPVDYPVLSADPLRQNGHTAASVDAILSPDSIPALARRAIGRAEGAARFAIGRADVWVVAGLIGFGVILPVVVGLASGSLDMPRNDDWTFRRIALALYETGRFELNGFEAMTLLGQILLAQPFLWLSRGETWGLSLAGISFAIFAIVFGYLLVRRVVPRGRAVLAMALLLLFPGFLPYAPSFMTDVPAIAASFACLWLGVIALDGPSIRWRWLIASAAVGLVAFSIRDVTLAAPASVLLVAGIKEPRRPWPLLIAVGLALGCLVIYTWRWTLDGQMEPLDRPNLVAALARTSVVFSTIAFILFPAVVVALATWWRRLRGLDVAIGVAIALIIMSGRIVTFANTGTVPDGLLYIVASRWGAIGADVVLGGRPTLFSDAAWSGLNALAFIATVVGLGTSVGILGSLLRDGLVRRSIAATRAGSPVVILALFAGATVGGVIAFGLVGTLWDRYIWPVIPPLAALILVARPRPMASPETPVEPGSGGRARILASVTVGSLVAILGVTAAMFLLNSAAFDSARWRAGEALVRQGVPASTIDAGFEWVGYHAVEPARTGNRQSTPDWWVQLFPSFTTCGVVSSAPLELTGARLVTTDPVSYRLLLLTGLEQPLYQYRLSGPGCPPG